MRPSRPPRARGRDTGAVEGPAPSVRASAPPALLRTKLHRPPVSDDIVCRDRLHGLLNLGLETPLILVSAPAGYGKSTLVSQWIESRDEPCAWLSLDDSDSEPEAFVSYLTAAIETIIPASCARTKELAKSPSPPPGSILVESLTNELDAIKTPFFLVLDDYQHLAPGSRVHELLERLLRSPPKPLRLVLLSRRDPPLSLHAMRRTGQVTEVRLQELRFTAPETAALLEGKAGLTPDDDALTTLDREVEGWVGGLCLVSLALRHVEKPNDFLKRMRGGVQHIQQYLLQEVIAHAECQLRECLLSMSILDRFSAELCEAVCETTLVNGPDAGDRLLRSLVEANLFVVALDNRGEWFRFHHLFQDLLKGLLQRERTEEDVAELHGRASAWFAESGLIDEALRHALAGGDTPGAVRLVEQHRHDLMSTEQWGLLDQWLESLPPGAVAASPPLLCARAYLKDQRGHVTGAFADRDRAEELLSALPPAAPEPTTRGELVILHGLEAIFTGEAEDVVERTERAEALLPPEAAYVHSYAVGVRAVAHQMAGEFDRGLEVIAEALGTRSKGADSYQLRMMFARCVVGMMQGDLGTLKAPALRCVELGEELELPEAFSFGRYFLGIHHYLRNELQEAERYLTALMESRFAARPLYLAQGVFALALIHAVRGQHEEASRLVQSVINHATETSSPAAHVMARAFAVELALRRGHVDEARSPSLDRDFAPLPPLWFFYVPQLTPARVLLARGTPQALGEARARLEAFEGHVRRLNRNLVRIDVLCLRSLVLAALGEDSAAQETLTEGLALAEPGGTVRSFLDLGSPMSKLLQGLPRPVAEGDFVVRLIAAFAEEPKRNALDGGDGPRSEARPVRSGPGAGAGADELTTREREVLELLGERLRDKEIAARLFVSPETVNTHLKHVYQKLDVRGRRQAVARATSLGILNAP